MRIVRKDAGGTAGYCWFCRWVERRKTRTINHNSIFERDQYKPSPGNTSEYYLPFAKLSNYTKSKPPTNSHISYSLTSNSRYTWHEKNNIFVWFNTSHTLASFFPIFFVVLRVPLQTLCSFSVRFVLSSCRFCLLFLGSRSSLFFSLPCFPWWRILLFCYFVSALPSPRAPCEPEVFVFPSRASSLRRWCCLFFFFSSFPFSMLIWRSLVSSSIFLVTRISGFGFCRDSFSIRVIRILIRTYVDLTFFSCRRHTICFSYCVYDLLFLRNICFPPEVIFRSRVVRACPVATDCIVAIY